MSKNLTKEQWIKVLKIYEKYGVNKAINLYNKINGKYVKERFLRKRIRQKYLLVQNKGMKSLNRKPGSGSGRKPKIDNSDIPEIIDDLTEDQKRQIIEDWIKEQRRKKNKNKFSSFTGFSVSLKSKILHMHRTTFYKKSKKRYYKYAWLESRVNKILKDSRGIYGSRRISETLANDNVQFNDRTLRRYMNRWGLETLTRRKKRKSESKNTNVPYSDLVRRNYNPSEDMILATDVSYIPASVLQNNIYLSVVISHKTKYIEAWELSMVNDTSLVVNTLNKLSPDRRGFILHSDHGSQYSTEAVQKVLASRSAKTSMGRVGNSLDNREVEYFFGCLKSEYLYHMNTSTMSYKEIRRHIAWYIDWYNNQRIQKVLKWKAPAFASAYAF